MLIISNAHGRVSDMGRYRYAITIVLFAQQSSTLAEQDPDSGKVHVTDFRKQLSNYDQGGP